MNVGRIGQSGGQRESTKGRRGSPFLVMERQPFEVLSPEDWPIRILFSALIAKLNSVSEGENKCSQFPRWSVFVFRMTGNPEVGDRLVAVSGLPTIQQVRFP